MTIFGDFSGYCPDRTLVAMLGQHGESFLGIRSNFIGLVKGMMFGITPDRHTWMLELSSEPFVKGSPMYAEYCAVLLDLSGTINDLIPKKMPRAGRFETWCKLHFGNSPF